MVLVLLSANIKRLSCLSYEVFFVSNWRQKPGHKYRLLLTGKSPSLTNQERGMEDFIKLSRHKLLPATEMDLFGSELWRSSFFSVHNGKIPLTCRISQLKVRLKFHFLKGNHVWMLHSRSSISVQCRIDRYLVLAWYLLSLFIWRESLITLSLQCISFTIVKKKKKTSFESVMSGHWLRWPEMGICGHFIFVL